MPETGAGRPSAAAPLGFDDEDCPLDKGLVPSFESLFFEPFYQLMRQQFLAHGMEKARELKADVVSLLHVAPDRNKDFRKVTSPELKPLGATATGVWNRLVRTHDRFLSVSTERMFGPLLTEPPAGLQDWADYLNGRYPWAGGAAVV